MNLAGMWIDRLQERRPIREILLDRDSSVSETYGEQEGSAYNGHFRCTCYHPLFCFNQFGDLERATTSRTTKSGCNCLPWRTTWATSCEGWHCPMV